MINRLFFLTGPTFPISHHFIKKVQQFFLNQGVQNIIQSSKN